jgi:TRAP-type C4-dicarboxylate transport system substrate-binding protein
MKMVKKEMKMKHVKLMCLVLSLVVFGAFCFAGSLSAQTKPVTITYSQLLPPTHPIAALTAEWGKEIEQKTNGRVTVRVHWAGTLLGPDKVYDGVVNGIADAATFSPAFNVGKFPLTEVFDYPLGFTSSQQATKLLNEYLATFKPKEFDQVKILYAYTTTPFVFHTNKPVKKFEDLKGLKIRTTGTSARVVSALGGTPVALPIGETYDALSRGVIDSTLTTIEALKTFKFSEVTKYTTSGPSANFTLLQIAFINKGTWEKIPKDAQAIIEEVSKEYADKSAKAYDAIDASIKEATAQAGHKFITLSAAENARWGKAVAPLLDGYVKDKKQQGLPADEVLKFCQDRLK